MSYLEQLKSENTHPEALPKLPEPPFDSFDSRGKRHFSEKSPSVAVVDTGTATDPPDVLTAADVFTSTDPDDEEINLADLILHRLEAIGRPATVDEIIEGVDGTPGAIRAMLGRLLVVGLAEQTENLRYRLPPWPPRPVDLPSGCPLTGAAFPETGCRFHWKLFERLKAEKVLPLPNGGCPLRAVCGVAR
jgi:hypothetical protein